MNILSRSYGTTLSDQIHVDFQMRIEREIKIFEGLMVNIFSYFIKHLFKFSAAQVQETTRPSANYTSYIKSNSLKPLRMLKAISGEKRNIVERGELG